MFIYLNWLLRELYVFFLIIYFLDLICFTVEIMDSEVGLVVGTVLVNYQWLIDDKSINQLFIYLSWLSRELCVFILFYESDSFNALAIMGG